MAPTVTENEENNEKIDEGDKPEARTDRMWLALKAHVLRERAKKRQQREAKVEEERLRLERERQDDMTLSEIRDQIGTLEERLEKLKEEKHQLFRALKKALHEDDIRKRHQKVNESEMMPMNVAAPMMTAANVQTPLYISGGAPQSHGSMPTAPPQTLSGAQVKVPGQPGLHPSNMQQTPGSYKKGVTITPSGMKRTRSPSPHGQMNLGYGGGQPGYQSQFKPQQYAQSPKDDGTRRHEFVRAVLWNKPSQYANQPTTAFYPTNSPSERSSNSNAPPPIMYYPAGRSSQNDLRASESSRVSTHHTIYEGYPRGVPTQSTAPHHSISQSITKGGNYGSVRSQSIPQYQQQSQMYGSASGGHRENVTRQGVFQTGPGLSGALNSGYLPPGNRE